MLLWNEATAAVTRPLPPPGDLMAPRRDMAPCLADLPKPPRPGDDAAQVQALENTIKCLAEVGGANAIKLDGLQEYARSVSQPPKKT